MAFCTVQVVMKWQMLAVAVLLLGFCTNSALITDVEAVKTLPANQTTPTPPANQTTPTPTIPANLTKVLTPSPVVPTSSPTPSSPETGHYNVSQGAAPCIMAQLGVQLVIKGKTEDLYFNVPPRSTEAAGQCGQHLSWIMLKFSGGFVNFTFVKDGAQYYVSEITAALRSKDGDYTGSMAGLKLFGASVGHSYRCQSEQVVSLLGGLLQIHTFHTWLQAFNIKDGKFGSVDQCMMFYSFLVPVMIGMILLILLVSMFTWWVFFRYFRSVGYQRI
eukprot:gi/632978532/ref/XP_007905965.1/ PREDICTED: lysosome-associated membrane glycoprotein 3 isoform X2 [Callorhinchus milii]